MSRQDVKEQRVFDILCDTAESYNIDITQTHNDTDAEYCRAKIETIREVASATDISTQVIYDEANRIAEISVGTFKKQL